MTAVPVQRTWVVGEFVTAAYMNSNVRDAVTFVLKQPACSAYNNAGAVIPTGGANATLIGLDTTQLDRDPNGLSAHSITSHISRVVCNYPGDYLVIAKIAWPLNATGVRQVDVRVNANGSPTGGALMRTQRQDADQNSVTWTQFTELSPRADGDYFELFGYQTSGGSLTTANAILQIMRVSGA